MFCFALLLLLAVAGRIVAHDNVRHVPRRVIEKCLLQKSTLVVGLLQPKDVSYLEHRIGFASSAGAFVLAMQRIEQEQLVPGREFK